MVCRLPLLPSWIPFTILLAIYMSLVFGEIPGDKDFNNGEAAETSSNVTKNYNLTGIPQIDYVHDPNLPRELNGHNLSSYPFLNRVPPTNYSCEGLKDGFYASVEYNCQLYHQCLFGNRYDFLCANYTAFDQRTFICHFVSEVDCPNSALFFHRNDALYIGPTTTAAPLRQRPSRGRQRVSPLRPEKISNAEPAPAKTSTPLNNQESEYDADTAKADDDGDEEYEDDTLPRRKDRKRNRNRFRGRRRNCRGRRWCRRKRPQTYYDDYYEDDDYQEDYEDDYQDDYDDSPRRPTKPRGKNKTRTKGTRKETIQSSSSINSSTSAPAPNSVAEPVSTPAGNNSTPVPLEEIFSQSRPPPKIRPPVPKHAVSKYEFMQGRSSSGTAPQTSISSTTAVTQTAPKQSQKTENAEYAEYDYEPSSTLKTNRQLRTRLQQFKTSTTTTTTTPRPTTTTTTTTTTSTTTAAPRTTEAPEYEYYDYEEDEMPQQEDPKSLSPIPTTTTTTTTTQRPQVNNRRLRNRKPEISSTTQESVYSTSSNPILVTHDTSVSVSAKTSSLPDRFLRRPKPALKVYSNSNQAVTEPVAPIVSSTTPEIPSSSIRQQQSNFNQRFPSYEVTNSKPSEPQTARPSRFWQRQQKIVTSTTTTLAPQQPEYVEYYDDSTPLRYGSHKSASTYPQQQQQSSQQQQQQQPQPQQQQQQQRPLIQQQQYSSMQDSTEIPQRMINYNTSPRYPQSTPNIRPLDQSNFVTPYATQQPNNMRPTPEFISLIPDEDPYYSVDPHNSRRFHNTPVRQYSAAQETYPSYAPPPPTYGQYLKRIQQRHVVPQSYPWY